MHSRALTPKLFPFILQYFTFIYWKQNPWNSAYSLFLSDISQQTRGGLLNRIKEERKLKGFSLFIHQRRCYWCFSPLLRKDGRTHETLLYTSSTKHLFSGLHLHLWIINLTLCVGRYLAHCALHVVEFMYIE